MKRRLATITIDLDTETGGASMVQNVTGETEFAIHLNTKDATTNQEIETILCHELGHVVGQVLNHPSHQPLLICQNIAPGVKFPSEVYAWGAAAKMQPNLHWEAVQRGLASYEEEWLQLPVWLKNRLSKLLDHGGKDRVVLPDKAGQVIEGEVGEVSDASD